MAKITYNDKVSVRTSSYPAVNQVSADDVNEIKASVNDLYDIVGAGSETDNLIVVSINTAGTTNKIKSTVEAITDSAVDNTYLVQVRPGIYVEDDFTIPEYVAVIADGDDRVTEIQANTTTGDLVTLSSNTTFGQFKISGKTSGNAISYTQAGGCKIYDFTFEDCDTGIYINNALSQVVISTIDLTGTMTTGIDIQAGRIDSKNIDIDPGHTVTTVYNIENSSSHVHILDLICESSNVTTLINVADGPELIGTAIQATGFYDGLVVSGNDCNIRINAMNLIDAQNDGARIESTGTGIELSMFDTTIIGSTNLNANFNNATCIVNGNGFTETDKVYLYPGAKMYASLLDTREDDEGLNIYGELHVGTPEQPTESVFGEGDSHIRFLAYTTDDDVVFTDVSEEARSPSGSTFTFESTSAGSSIYVANLAKDSTGSPKTFGGVKSIVNTAAVLGTGNFVIQYYNSISGWLDVDVMETQSGGRYYQHGNNILTHTGSHHIRGDINIGVETDSSLTWDLSDPVTYGESLYWIRLRIENAITTAPVLEQIKVHTSRSELNSDGWVEFFGASRPKANLPITLGAGRELGGNMGDANIWIDQNLGVGLIDNQFSSLTQYWGLSGTVPDDLDTSSGLDLNVICRADGAGAVTLGCSVGKITEGDSAYLTNPALGPIPSRADYTDTQTFTAADDVRFFTFHIDTSGFISRKNPADGTTTPDIAFITIYATVLPVNVQMIHMENDYFQWSSGGHV